MDQYLIYLRKSRKDMDLEQLTGQYDTLQRHRDALLNLAKQRGYAIAQIFEEVVSGDTIADRPEMQKLLAAVETGNYAGVLVMEIPRLARGNTRDQGIVSETFGYSGTKIITPDKTYDPHDEADEEYFEFGLFMSRREYKSINRRLQRGRLTSLSEGKYIAGAAPYGYKKTKLQNQKGWSLEIDPDTADVVREIFSSYLNGKGSYIIANNLNARGILSPGGVAWSAPSVRDILKNPTYAGYVRWSYRPDKKQMVDGEVVVSHPVNKEARIEKGLHEAIISEEQWRQAQSILEGRGCVPVPGKKEISNPLAGVLRCSICGRSLVQVPLKGKRSNFLHCPTVKCPTKGSNRDAVEEALLETLDQWLKDYTLDMEAEWKALDHREEFRTLERQQEQLEKRKRELEVQRGKLFDFLEQGIYSQEIFLERSRVLRERMTEAEQQSGEVEKQLQQLKAAEAARRELIPNVQTVLGVYHSLQTPAERNAMWKTVLDHVVYEKSKGGKWQESDLKLYVYPKIRGQKADTVHIP